MEIRITKTVSMKIGQFLVSFESNYGAAEGLWSGKAPELNEKADVEIDLGDELVWSVNVFSCLEKNPILEKMDKDFRVVAKIESIEVDGCCVLRLGDSILMTEIENLPSLEKGTFIELKPHAIKLFSSNL